ncbi:MAG: hypothetical protein RL376_1591 [Verrucomicrobiota bacterium]|jgi:UPF0271 protein
MDLPRDLDLNADVGEGGRWDEALFAAGITSANIACGAHAGDERMMAAACALAVRHGVALGAHPGYADREHFGRRAVRLTSGEIAELLRAQLRALAALAEQAGGRVGHVKPHGALYHWLHRDRAAAEAAVRVVATELPGARVVGLPEGAWREAAEACGLGFVPEGFIDRAYDAGGSLMPRTQVGAVLTDEAAVAAQAVALARAGRVRTLCLHGDGAEALRFLLAARGELLAAGFRISAPKPE